MECCYIEGSVAGGDLCHETAEFEISPTEDQDMYQFTQACPRHVGYLLSDGITVVTSL